MAVLLLFLSNARVALENIIKYGILVNPGQVLEWLISEQRGYKTFIALFLSQNIFAWVALVLEKAAATGRLSNSIVFTGHGINIVLLLILPALGSLKANLSPISSIMLCGAVSVLSLKLVSYLQVNFWCRSGRAEGETPVANGPSSSRGAPKIVYPHNLTTGNLYYFLAAPTLCYELNYPRSPRFRKWFFLKRLTEVVLLSQVILALSQQWIVPLLINSQKPFIEMDYTRIVERMMKLSIPNHVIWLINFYLLFHSWLNLLAEMTGFADREFYRDWWNSETINYFWQTWNIPVHRWCLRHVFKPLRSAGYSSFTCAVCVFLVSAFYHEYAVSVPLSMFRLWAFSGMLAQIPLNFLTAFLRGGKAGNVAVWLSLIIGQPLAILMYVHDYYVINYLTATR